MADTWTDEFYPPDQFEDAKPNPLEIADHLSPEARQALIGEAVARYKVDNWQRRRDDFIRRLNFFERVWFG